MDELVSVKEKFIVYYQPQMVLATGEIVGAEALVRKLGPSGEIIMPQSFIPQYEESDRIHLVDFAVLEAVCKEMHRWNGLALLLCWMISGQNIPIYVS